jgi:RNA polymerase subunit RPABC4/transcription elongation factor Spt4
MIASWVRAVGASLFFAASLGASASLMPDFDALEQKLKIRAEQKDQFEMAVGATKRALFAVGLAALQLKQRLAQELMKDRPDFSALAREQEMVVDQTRPLFREAGEEWKKLYAILDPEQVQIAKSYLKENFGRFF